MLVGKPRSAPDRILAELPCSDCMGDGIIDNLITEDGQRILCGTCDGSGVMYAQREFWTGGWTYYDVPAPIGHIDIEEDT